MPPDGFGEILFLVMALVAVFLVMAGIVVRL